MIALVLAASHCTTSSPARLGDFVLRCLRINWYNIETKFTESHVFVISVLLATSRLLYLRVLNLHVPKHAVLEVVIAFYNVDKTLSLIFECLSFLTFAFLPIPWLNGLAILLT